ncbi:MAG: hypothetical protein HZA79_09850 [Sphingobacteriales bacterium]|nr:hypothetical protein [Sphingobacteriales bacterium]
MQEHTAANPDRLMQSIQANYSLSAEVVCFSCILTLPEQSDIRVSFINNGSPVHKVFDLSHPTGSNLMKVISMHN